jgi:F-box protein 9
MNTEESNPELESFREQWRAEVQSKRSAPGSSRQQQQQQQQQQSRQQRAAGPSNTQPRTGPATGPRGKPPQPAQKLPAQELDDEYVQSQSFDEPAISTQTPSLETGRPKATEGAEPVSALEHYEKAVEKEAVGNLGDSLRLYRKAFRVRYGQTLDTEDLYD